MSGSTDLPSPRPPHDRTSRFNELVTLSLFSTMFLVALMLPDAGGGEYTRQLLAKARPIPNFEQLAARAYDPTLVEVYLLSCLIGAVLALLIFVTCRPKDWLAPLDSHLHKFAVLAMAAAMAIAYSTLLWHPATTDFEIGLLSGRWGAFMHLALSGRFGMAILLNLFFCVGPYLLLSFFWIVINKPIRS